MGTKKQDQKLTPLREHILMISYNKTSIINDFLNKWNLICFHTDNNHQELENIFYKNNLLFLVVQQFEYSEYSPMRSKRTHNNRNITQNE